MKLYMVISEVGWDGVEVVEGVYTNREVAEHCAKVYGGAEVREILTNRIPGSPKGHYPYEVRLYRDGRVHSMGLVNIREFEDKRFFVRTSYESKVGTFEVFAKDQEHAIQLARERGAERIASGEWPPGWADRDLIPMSAPKGANE